MKIAILGFGNPARSDDGAGCHVISLLKNHDLPDNISLLDMGTSAFEILFQLKGHNHIILVDAVINSNEPDGTTFKLPASEIDAAIIDDPMVFLHGLKWDQALSYAKKIMQDDFPKDEITVYLISVTDTRLEIGLSDVVKSAAEKVSEHILASLKVLNDGTHI
jgi:hydrogenase maturation protease